MLRRLFVQGMFLLSSGLIATSSYAAFEFPLEAMQPLVTEEGIFLSTVSYVKYTGSLEPGYEVTFVGEASCVIDDRGHSVNRNIANLLGIRTGAGLTPGRDALSGDTLRVWIDLSGIKEERAKDDLRDWSVSGVVKATVECVLTTASNCIVRYDHKLGRGVPAKWVDLRIHGSPEYASLSGVFSFATLGKLPRVRQFE